MEVQTEAEPFRPRSIFLQWNHLFIEGERLLDDLAELVGINSIELSSLCLDWGPRSGPRSPDGAPLALPPEADFDGLPVLAADERLFRSLLDTIQLIRSKGFRVVCNLMPIYVASPGLARLRMTDVTGAPVAGHHPQVVADACPSNPDTVAYATTIARELVRWWPLDAVTINHAEYSLWPEGGLSQLVTCFCDACRTRADGRLVPFTRLARDVSGAYNSLLRGSRLLGRGSIGPADVLHVVINRPYLAQWLHFRSQSMTDLVEAVVGSLRDGAQRCGRQLSLGLESQLPTLSILVGTDFERLSPLVDWLIPKFPDYVAGSAIPRIADGLASRAHVSTATIGRALRQFLDLGPGPERYRSSDYPEQGLVYSNAFDENDMRRQLSYLERAEVSVPTVPYLWLHNRDAGQLSRRIRLCHEYGLDGFFLWCWEQNLTREALRGLRSARA